MRINPFNESIECLTEKTDVASTTKNRLDCEPGYYCTPMEPSCSPEAGCIPTSPPCPPDQCKVKDNKMNCNPDGTLNLSNPKHDLRTNRPNPKKREVDQKESLATKTPWCHPDDDACNPNDDLCGPMCEPDVGNCDPGYPL